MNKRRKLLWTERINVRWGDMDALGHVNNVEYFRYMEQARFAWMLAIKVPVVQDNRGPVAVRAVCDFLKPIVYPATIAVAIYLGRVGRSSITLHHDIYRGSRPRTLFARGEIVMAWIDHDRGKSVPIPEALKRYLG
jgi:acyl-CoA thioester hydrolase